MVTRIYAALAVLALLATGILAEEPDRSKETAADRPMSAFQAELIDLSFTAGSAIPAEADLSDRSKSQEAALSAWLQLQQPNRVLKDIGKIGNWRRGAVYADLAMYCAHSGFAGNVQKYLDNAAEIAKSASDWQKDRIRVKVAQVHAWMGHAEEAARFEAGVDFADQGKVIRLTSRPVDATSFEAQMRELDRLTAMREKFDVIRNALTSAVAIFDVVYDQPDRRTAVEKQIRASLNVMPVFIRIELVMAMSNSALEHKDQPASKRLADEAQAMKDASKWVVEDEISMTVRLAVQQFRTGDQGDQGNQGDQEQARMDVARALAMYEAEREKVLSSKRTESLLLVAEAFHEMGDAARSIKVYKMALAECASNPNGRPRALDLSATCRSLGLNGVEPDAELWEQIRKTLVGLGPPW